MKLREWMRAAGFWLKRAITEPRSELDRWEASLRFGYDLVRFGTRQLKQDHAPRMAGALAFRTLFGLLPVMVVSTVLVKAVQGVEQFKTTLTNLIEEAGLYELVINVGNGEAAGQSVGHMLEVVIGEAAQVNLAAVGWVGLAVLIYTAISLMVTIEGCFNSIYRAPEGRPWMQRVPVYFFVLIGWPAAFGVITYFNNQLTGWMETLSTSSWLLALLPSLWAFVFIWLVMLAVYLLVPSTHVGVRPALVGSLVAAMLIELGRWALVTYMQNAISLRQLYGSLGLIPVFMFWVYVMWLFILFGLEVSSILQRLRGRAFEEFERSNQPTGMVDPASVLVVMQLILQRFNEGKPTSAQFIIEETGLPESAVMRMLERLQKEKFVHQVSVDEPKYALARPAESISAEELVQLGYDLSEGSGHLRLTPFIQRLRDSQKELAATVSLAAVTRDSAASGAGQA